MDDRMFRNAMGKFATGVTVITTELDGEVHGMTANAFMSVSLNPKLVVISIGEKAKMLNKINESKKFAVNILADEQKEVSMMFAGQIKEKRDIEFDRLGDLPVIKDSLANISCKVYSQHVEGDHTLFIGEVTDIVLRDGEALAFYEGKYREIAKLVDVN
ncbi:flavin reductase family protein [Neobacillus mesonae]|uniref:flavin reductase family protein n=1 Tax=Neobacillus mesonae TaxID=1193713 RepID=UPI00257435A6|nr:flavin reductase family protein [Neobacillus mesonae]MED4205364.1 flavin reductase family protein [Neobacillus mesonae]